MQTLNQIKGMIDQLAAQIGAPAEYLPTYGYSRGDGLPHITVDDNQYHYISEERGHKISHVASSDLDDILYKVFEGVTNLLARDLERGRNIAGQDFRVIVCRRQTELLSILSPSWAVRVQNLHRELIEKYPLRSDQNC